MRLIHFICAFLPRLARWHDNGEVVRGVSTFYPTLSRLSWMRSAATPTSLRL